MTDNHVLGQISTGIDGLNQNLNGGLITDRGHLVTGTPSTRKSILGHHILEAGAANGDTSLYINLEESISDTRTNVATLGFDLDNTEFLDLSPSSDAFSSESPYDIFSADEVEGEDLKQNIRTDNDDINPDRVFMEPITQLRDPTPDNYQSRTQVTAFVEYLQDQNATVLFSSVNSGMQLAF